MQLGVYFDVSVRNTTTLLLALRNDIPPDSGLRTNESDHALPDPAHFSFRPISPSDTPAPPISLLARVDDEEYVLLPNSSSLVSICLDSLDRNVDHYIRIIAPMHDDHGHGVVELEGLWLSKGGKLSRVPGSTLGDEFLDEDLLRAENDFVGEKHRAGINDIDEQGSKRLSSTDSNESEEDILNGNQGRKKVLEIVTDSPGRLTHKWRGGRSGGADGLLSGVMGWEYLLGEMFSVDHVGISVDGMCLIQDCVGGTAYPAGIGDVFFRRWETSLAFLCAQCLQLMQWPLRIRIFRTFMDVQRVRP